jgi:hypothetical protein
MNMQIDELVPAGAILFADDNDALVPTTWTLDELDDSGDLGSLRTVWAHTDDRIV